MKRIGIVGVGKWSTQLREAFKREGCEVVAHARKSEVPHPCSGPLVSVEEMVRMEDVDFVIAAADPETTTRAVELCAEWCKPVVATKPLLRHPQVLATPVHVDFWRLFSKPWLEMKRVTQGASLAGYDRSAKISVRFVGAGPKRGFSGLLDYGPHALAEIEDLGFRSDSFNASRVGFVETPTGTICHSNQHDIAFEFGNGAADREHSVKLISTSGAVFTFEDAGGILTYTAPNGQKLRQSKEEALRAFARAVLNPRFERGSPSYTTSFSVSVALDRILAEQARRSDEPTGHPVQDPARYPVPDQG